MSDKANIIVVDTRSSLNETEDIITGLLLYSHWGGCNALITALQSVISFGLGRAHDPAYFNRIIARAFTAGHDGDAGSGITPIAIIVPKDQSIEKAVNSRTINLDNGGHYVPVIDLIDKAIMLYDYGWAAGFIRFKQFHLDKDGVEQAITAL